MPYIKREARAEIIKNKTAAIQTPGHLNYFITTTCKIYLKDRGESYQTYNDIVGVLECVKQEYYRRRIAPYENVQLKRNGDVF